MKFLKSVKLIRPMFNTPKKKGVYTIFIKATKTKTPVNNI